MNSNVAAAVSTTTIENVVNLPSYTVVIQMNMDNYSFELLTNFEFMAGSKEAALKVAGPMLNDLIPFVEANYDSNQQELTIRIEDNKYFDSIEIRNFEIYDESQFDLVSTLSSATNLKCYSFVSREQFYEHLTTQPYNLKFEAVGYGIALLN
ncbi:hypothetical protein ACOMCU_25125 [Lysinibacillus sp. UGB7]|uniref:hypothetical protein n=1 Tax=Lysinibacillus sp. UGB7 TaxID=3411039 RepID=UPI003B769431